MSAGGESYVENTAQLRVASRKMPLPPALVEAYRTLTCSCFMGLLPEIRRAWVTVDNKLFLWNHDEGADLYVYDGVDEAILSVALVPPRPGVFVDEVRYLLALATPLQVVLVALSFTSPTDFSILPTQLSAPTDAVHMLRMQGTPSGRLFMCGKDGCLYELQYQAEESWFARKVRKVNLTASPLAALVPSFLRWADDGPLTAVAFERSRNLLFTLSAQSVITAYDLGPDGRALRRVAAKANVGRDAAQLARHWPSDAWDALRIVHLLPVSLAESHALCLVAVAANGARLYFACQPRGRALPAPGMDLARERPAALDLVHVRTPPPLSGDGGRRSQVHAALYAEGLTLLADAAEEERDTLAMLARDVAPPYAAERRDMAVLSAGARLPALEQVASAALDGKTWALAEALPPPSPAGSLAALLRGHTGGGAGASGALLGARNELLYQHVLPSGRSFLALTTGGLYRLTKLRPVDELRLHLERNEAGALDRLFDRLGAEQACLQLLLMCAHPAATFGAGGLPSDDVLRRAQQLLFERAGKAQFRRPPPAAAAPDSFASFAPLPGADLLFSPLHDALVSHTGRLLRPLWLVPLFRLSPAASAAAAAMPAASAMVSRVLGAARPELTLALDAAQLQETADLLAALRRFLVERVLGASAAPAAAADVADTPLRTRVVALQGRREDDALRLERRSLVTLSALLARAIESVNFLLILQAQNLADLLSHFTDAFVERVRLLRLRDLVAFSAESCEAALYLVLTMMQLNGAHVRDQLRARCPAFFSADHFLLLEAQELLYRVAQAPSPAERLALLAEAADNCRKLGARLSPAALVELCAQFRFWRYYEGALDLALAFAAALDPANAALDWERERRADAAASGAVPPALERAREAWEERNRAYEAALEPALDELWGAPALPAPSDAPRPPLENVERTRKALAERVLRSRDRLAQFRLFGWLLARRDTAALLELGAGDALEAFLREREALAELAKLYLHQERWGAAATILTFIARLPPAQLRDLLARQALPAAPAPPTAAPAPAPAPAAGRRELLDARLSYLSQALTAARSAGGVGVGAEQVEELEAALDVAQVQLSIHAALASRAAATDEEREAMRALDEELLDLSALYNRYARRYQLWEACLAILRSARHADLELVLRVWRGLVAQLLAPANGALPMRLEALGAKVRSLVRVYHPSDVIVPVPLLVELLEGAVLEALAADPQRQAPARAPELVQGWLLDAGVAHALLFDAYARLLDEGAVAGRPRTGLRQPLRLHLRRALLALVAAWIAHAFGPGAPAAERRALDAKRLQVESALAKALAELTAEGAQELVAAYKSVQGQLQRGGAR